MKRLFFRREEGSSIGSGGVREQVYLKAFGRGKCFFSERECFRRERRGGEEPKGVFSKKKGKKLATRRDSWRILFTRGKEVLLVKGR